jgi:Alpha/beta hydrolase domain
MNRRSIWIMVYALIFSVAFIRVAQSDAVAPTVTGPVTGGNGVPILFSHGSFDLATVGYKQTEFFITGMASSYSSTQPLTSDGRWDVEVSATSAPYVTRIVVDRPIRDRDFNGTVVVEWFNVSGQVDASPAWTFMHTELIRKGYAYVAVSAQFLGVNQLKNGGAAPGDPVRYASLNHPTDSYSYDIFSQAGQAIRSSAELVLGGLRPRRLIATGESQSAGRLVTYVNAVHPLVDVYDGFLIGSRGAGGSPLSQPPLAGVPTPVPTRIRDDLTTPVLVFNSETDAGALLARQEDSAVFRLWEVAGTSHFDLYGLFQGQVDTGRRQSVTDWFNSMLNPPTSPTPTANCPMPVNTGPRTFVQRAALAALNRWIAHGIQPPSAERLQTVNVSPVQYALDANGNVLGGIRTPAVDAPVAKLSGLGQTGTGAQFCFLFGTTVPFSAEKIAELYGSHGAFVVAWSRATLDAVKEGFLLPQDAVDILVVGAQSDVP